MTWSIRTHSKQMVWFEERLVPRWVCMSNGEEVLSQVRRGEEPNAIELWFKIRLSERDPEILCKFGEREDIYCTRISWNGMVSSEKLASLDFEMLGRLAYVEWLSTPVLDERVSELKIVASQRDWTSIATNRAKNAELAEVAWIYLQAPTRGTKNVQDAMGYGSRSTASLRVKEARAQSLIPPSNAAPEEYEAARRRLEKERNQREEKTQ